MLTNAQLEAAAVAAETWDPKISTVCNDFQMRKISETEEALCGWPAVAALIAGGEIVRPLEEEPIRMDIELLSSPYLRSSTIEALRDVIRAKYPDDSYLCMIDDRMGKKAAAIFRAAKTPE